MTRNRIVLSGAFCFVLAGGSILVAQRPAENIDPGKHAALAAAQRAIQQAYDKTEDARKAHGDQLGGHAEKAIQHMQAADAELKAAAEYLDAHHK
ncbi:MAG TPA: hypothetical protein VMJ35_09080 [Dongiaceae bacterium]|nr:hypothetical protein [Dongiaceae bacterium]